MLPAAGTLNSIAVLNIMKHMAFNMLLPKQSTGHLQYRLLPQDLPG